MLSNNNETDHHPSFLQSASGLPLPRPTSQFSHPTITTSSGLVLPHGQIFGGSTSNHASSMVSHELPKTITPVPIPNPGAQSPPQARPRSKGSRSSESNRKTLPVGQTTAATSQSFSTSAKGSVGWGDSGSPGKQGVNASSTQKSPRQTRSAASQPRQHQQQQRAGSSQSPNMTAAGVAQAQARSRASLFQQVDTRSRQPPPPTAQQPYNTGSQGYNRNVPQSNPNNNYNNTASTRAAQDQPMYDNFNQGAGGGQLNEQSTSRNSYEPFTSQNIASNDSYLGYGYNQPATTQPVMTRATAAIGGSQFNSNNSQQQSQQWGSTARAQNHSPVNNTQGPGYQNQQTRQQSDSYSGYNQDGRVGQQGATQGNWYGNNGYGGASGTTGSRYG